MKWVAVIADTTTRIGIAASARSSAPAQASADSRRRRWSTRAAEPAEQGDQPERQGDREHAHDDARDADQDVPGVVQRVVERAAARRLPVAVLRQQADRHDRVVGAQPQAVKPAAQGVDLAGHDVEPAPDRLRLGVRGGGLEPAEQALPLSARGTEPVPGGHVRGRHVAPGLALAAHVGERGEIAQRRADLVHRNAEVEVAAGGVLAGGDRRAEHEPAVPVRDGRDLIRDLLHLVDGRLELQRERALDPAVGPSGREAAIRHGSARGRERGLGSPSRRHPTRRRPPPALSATLPPEDARSESSLGEPDSPRGAGRRGTRHGHHGEEGAPAAGARCHHGRLRPRRLREARLHPLVEPLAVRGRGLGRVRAQRQRKLLELARHGIRLGRHAGLERVVDRGEHVSLRHGTPLSAS